LRPFAAFAVKRCFCFFRLRAITGSLASPTLAWRDGLRRWRRCRAISAMTLD